MDSVTKLAGRVDQLSLPASLNIVMTMPPEPMALATLQHHFKSTAAARKHKIPLHHPQDNLADELSPSLYRNDTNPSVTEVEHLKIFARQRLCQRIALKDQQFSMPREVKLLTDVPHLTAT